MPPPEDPSLSPGAASPPKLTGFRVSVVLAFLLSLTSLGGAGYLYLLLTGEQLERQSLEEAQAELEEQSNTLSQQVAQYRAMSDGMRDSLAQVVEDHQGFKDEMEQRRLESAELRSQLEAVQTRLAQAPAEMLDDLPVQEEAGEGAAEFPAASERPAEPVEAPVPAAPREPEVLTVNRKFNFIVVNLGQKDGLKLGDEIPILRDGKSIGKVQVERIFPDFAAATILQENKQGEIREGDAVQKPS